MSKKKQSKTQKAKAVEKEIDINDIDTMFENMKNLVLEKTEETKNNVVAHEDVKDEKIVNYLNESKDNVVISTDENVIFTNKEEEKSLTGPLVKCEFDEEGNLINEDEINAMAKSEIKEESEEESAKEENEKEVIEDLEKAEEENTEEEIDKEEEPKKKNKSKRMTYEEMFGHTWMGYGFSY